MKINSIYKAFKTFKGDLFSFIIQDELSQELTGSMLRIAEHNLELMEGNTAFRKKLPFLVIETYQNILKHADIPEFKHVTNNKPQMFGIRNKNNKYIISSTNLIEKEKATSLKEKLLKINTLSSDELKKLSVEVLQNKAFSTKGTAGLGLLEIARRTKNKIDFGFDFVNYYYMLFHSLIALENSQEELQHIHPEQDSSLIEENRAIYNFLDEEKIFLLHKEEFNQHTILPLLQIFETNIDTIKNISFYKKTYHIMVEILQNMCHYSEPFNNEKAGVFMLAKSTTGYEIATGNFAKNEHCQTIIEKINHIKKMNPEEVGILYKKEILKNTENADRNAGIGLIDIVRYSHSIECKSDKLDDNYSFLSLKVTIQ